MRCFRQLGEDMPKQSRYARTENIAERVRDLAHGIDAARVHLADLRTDDRRAVVPLERGRDGRY